MKQKVKIAFLGQKKIGEEALDILLKKYNEQVDVCLIVSNKSSENWWNSNNCYKTALKEAIPFVDNSARNEDKIIATLKHIQADYLVCVQHPWILSSEILNYFKNKAFNFHNAKLPDYKGHNCCNHAILNSEETYTVTAHLLEKEVDAGDIIFEEVFEVEKKETAFSLYNKANKKAIFIFESLIKVLSQGGKLKYRKQVSGRSVFYKRTSIDVHRKIPSDLSSEEKLVIAKALYFPPFEPAYELVSGEKMYLLPEGGR